MAIKWQDVKVGVSHLSNGIFIGKTRVEKGSLEIWTDKSGDKTQECVKAVMEHMMQKKKRDDTNAYRIDGFCELKIIDLKSEKQPCEYCKQIQNATPASPRKDYKFCPMCGEKLEKQ